MKEKGFLCGVSTRDLGSHFDKARKTSVLFPTNFPVMHVRISLMAPLSQYERGFNYSPSGK